MKASSVAVAASVVAALGATLAVGKTPQAPSASIPFVNHGGIQDWRSTDDETLYVEDANDRWFVAKTMGQCVGLKNAIDIVFKTQGTDTFDQFSTIIVKGQPCSIQSLTKISGPPPSSKPHKPKN